MVFVFHLSGYSALGVLIMDGRAPSLGVCGRLASSFRLLRSWLSRAGGSPEGKRVLIYGAGDGGELLVRASYSATAGWACKPSASSTTIRKRQGRVIHGVRVLGTIERLQDLAGAERVDEVLISTTKLAVERSVMLEDFCKAAGLRYRRMRIALE